MPRVRGAPLRANELDSSGEALSPEVAKQLNDALQQLDLDIPEGTVFNPYSGIDPRFVGTYVSMKKRKKP